MEALTSVLTIALGIFVIIVLIKIITAPIKGIFKLILNTVTGFVTLAIVNFLGSFVGLSLEVNLINAVVTGIFGIPGVIVLIILRLFF